MNINEIMIDLNHVTSIITNLANAWLKPYGITYSQLMILDYLVDNQDEVINQKSICVRFDISHATAVGLITRMYGRDLIEINISESDRRNTNVILTAHGRAVYQDTRVVEERLNSLFKGNLNNEEIIKFYSYLKRMEKSLKSGE